MSIAGNLEKIFSLEDKVVLLTGATGGIGSVLAKGMAAVGAQMALCDINQKLLDELQGEIEPEVCAKSFVLDILSMDSIKSCVNSVINEFGRIDILINCAGINKREGFLDVEEATYDRIMGVNLKGLYFLTQEVVKNYMIKANKGNIINIASHTSVAALGGVSVYGATKSAVTALTQSMAIEWAKYSIRANAIAPGHILTALTTVTWDNPARAKYLRERIAMGRPGAPEEILGLAIMLASDASSYMTGMMYHIDGGCLAGGQPWPYDTKY